jgi:hypothetical protein
MSEAVQFELGPLTIAVVATRRGRTELSVSAFDQRLGTLTTTLEPELETLLASEAEQVALFDLFKDHCAPLLRRRAQRGTGNSDALCIRLTHPCDNPQCNAVHELLCMNTATQLLAQATPAPAGTGTPFTLVDEDGHPLADIQHLAEADTERLLLQHAAPALVEMANFFTPACMETDLDRWEPPTDADQDIVNYFGFFSGSPDAVYGIFQYVNPLLLSIWMERIDAYAHDQRAQDKATAQEAWFKLMAKLLVLPENHLAASAARPREAGAHLLHATAPTRRLH